MKEWKEGKLSDIANIIMGQSPKGETCNSEGRGIPLLNGPTEFGVRNPSAVQFTTDPKRMSDKYDILFCVRGSTTGKMNWADMPYSIGRGLAAINHKEGREYRYFIKGVLDFHLPNLLSFATGSTFPNVSRGQLENLEIKYPPLPEQKAIAATLSALDDKIDLLHRQNATLEGMAEVLFREWFVEQAEDDWEEGVLGDFADNIKKGIAVKDFDLNGKYIALEHIDKQSIALNKFTGTQAVASNKFSFDKRDILFGKLRPYFHKVCFTSFSGICSTDILVIRPKTEDLFCFCLFAFFQEDVVDYANMGTSGTRMPRSSWKVLNQYPVKIPPSYLLEKFQKIIINNIEKIESNITQIQTLETLRDTLLPKLMSGEVRVRY